MLSNIFENCLTVELNDYQPTNDKQNSSLAPLPTCKGVILFADADDRPIQLLIAANIRRTAIARLGEQDETTSQKRADLKSIVKKIYYSRTYNDLRNSLIHLLAAKSIDPDEYRKIVKLVRLTFVKIDLSARWPTFHTTEKTSVSVKQKLFGLFPSRKSSNDFVKILQDSFDLCQMPQLIGNGEKASSCPYLQMKTCPAPCMGRIDREEYLAQIHSAIDAGCGNSARQKAILTEKMNDAAANMEFENASHLKKQIDQLDILRKDNYRWTGDLSKMSILHIDRSAKMSVKKRRKLQLFTAFLIRQDHVWEIGDFSLDSFDELCKKAAEIESDSSMYDRFSMDLPANELLGITSFHLYRSNARGVWVDCRANKKLNPELLQEMAREWFNIERSEAIKDEQNGSE